MAKYYKLINGQNFVGIASQLDFRKYQEKHQILLWCIVDEAQYVQIGDNLYHDDWLAPVTADKYEYEDVDIIEIEESEYNTLSAAIESGEEIEVETQDETTTEEVYVDPAEAVTLDYVMNAKIAEMSNTCDKVIEAGIDIVLSDGESHHFSLTVQDQLNLITLSSLISTGATAIPYHADGEACKYYSAEDISLIVTTATSFKTYQVSYFNALKIYIQSMTDIETVSAVYYGIEIPEEYQTEVLQSIYVQMAGSGQ